MEHPSQPRAIFCLTQVTRISKIVLNKNYSGDLVIEIGMHLAKPNQTQPDVFGQPNPIFFCFLPKTRPDKNKKNPKPDLSQ